jgi:Transcriptional Coactivator p15 (PC4)
VNVSQNDETRNSSRNESQPVIIAQWELNSRESLRVELNEYRGTQLIGIRKWFAGASGVMTPGKSGINLSLKHLPRLAAAINDALSKAREEGLITADDGRDQR